MNTLAQMFRTSLEQLSRSVPKDIRWSLRGVFTSTEHISVRQNVVQPLRFLQSQGLFLTLCDGIGMGYGANNQIHPQALDHTLRQALSWMHSSRGKMLFPPRIIPVVNSAYYESPQITPWGDMPLSDKIALLQQVNQALKTDERIVDWYACLNYKKTQQFFATSAECMIEQVFHYIAPGMYALANAASESQCRSGGGFDTARQGGLEQLTDLHFPAAAAQISAEAIELLYAQPCPQEQMDVLLMPNQMVLQIHESIGHPLELDRILGDERNFAGTSFVNLDMFGNYQYGSELLNISFKPDIPNELASYAYDDEGDPASFCYLIKNGLLLNPLGGRISQQRAGLTGVANMRACDWNRPAIDRMANLNLEPGLDNLATLISSIENGVIMDTNRSWSIDDSRNKFQFGCEIGRRIINGETRQIVKNPNYRGISASFWRNLIKVGDLSTFQVLGTPNCGKGEPNQCIAVGHATPACVFRDVHVFGGE